LVAGEYDYNCKLRSEETGMEKVLLDDWKWIVKRAWSFRLMLLAAGFSGVEMALPIVGDRLPQMLFAGLTFVVTVAAIIARLLVQRREAEEGIAVDSGTEEL
jgi:hypothetical protein